MKNMTTHNSALKSNVVKWSPVYRGNPYSFTNPNHAKCLTKGFIEFVKLCQKTKIKATVKGYYELRGKTYTPGNCSTFFAAITQAKIIDRKNGGYVIGENYTPYIEGRLRKETPLFSLRF